MGARFKAWTNAGWKSISAVPRRTGPACGHRRPRRWLQFAREMRSARTPTAAGEGPPSVALRRVDACAPRTYRQGGSVKPCASDCTRFQSSWNLDRIKQSSARARGIQIWRFPEPRRRHHNRRLCRAILFRQVAASVGQL